MANKNKTRRAAAKRFKVTGKKSPARKRKLRKGTVVSKADERNVKNLLGM